MTTSMPCTLIAAVPCCLASHDSAFQLGSGIPPHPSLNVAGSLQQTSGQGDPDEASSPDTQLSEMQIHARKSSMRKAALSCRRPASSASFPSGLLCSVNRRERKNLGNAWLCCRNGKEISFRAESGLELFALILK